MFGGWEEKLPSPTISYLESHNCSKLELESIKEVI